MSDVRAAAERLRKLSVDYNKRLLSENEFYAMRDCYYVLASAYLAEHEVDEDEPINLAFMQSLGFWMEEGDKFWQMEIHNERNDCIRLNFCEIENRLFLDEGTFYLLHIKTRGQVRQLLNLLRGE